MGFPKSVGYVGHICFMTRTKANEDNTVFGW